MQINFEIRIYSLIQCDFLQSNLMGIIYHLHDLSNNLPNKTTKAFGEN